MQQLDNLTNRKKQQKKQASATLRPNDSLCKREPWWQLAKITPGTPIGQIAKHNPTLITNGMMDKC